MCKYPKGPTRVRNRAVMDMSPASAKALRGMAADLKCQVRDVGTAVDAFLGEISGQLDRRALETADLQRQLMETIATIDELKGELSASDQIISRQGVALLNHENKRRTVEDMTAWGHVQVAIKKAPVACSLIAGLCAFCVGAAGALGHFILRGM